MELNVTAPSWLDNEGRINECGFAEWYLSLHPMRCTHDKLFSVEGIIGDESGIRNEIYMLIRSYVKNNVAQKVNQLLKAIKL